MATATTTACSVKVKPYHVLTYASIYGAPTTTSEVTWRIATSTNAYASTTLLFTYAAGTSATSTFYGGIQPTAVSQQAGSTTAALGSTEGAPTFLNFTAEGNTNLTGFSIPGFCQAGTVSLR